jgi:hypothetical protein
MHLPGSSSKILKESFIIMLNFSSLYLIIAEKKGDPQIPPAVIDAIFL